VPSGVRVPGTVRLATRGSPLALAQARSVAALIAEAAGGAVATELVVVETAGDRRRDVPLHEVGGQGLFVKEVERAVLEGRADVAVHSAKDLPASSAVLPIVAVPERADPRDVLVGRRLAELGPGAVVATGSVRRRAQLAWLRPGLTYRELRGNMATRLSAVPAGGAVIAAMAALSRLGQEDRAAEVLSTAAMLPQVGQGALAVCARPGDDGTAELVGRIDHVPSRRALTAERAWLAAVGGGCELPVGAYATTAEDGGLRLEAVIASLDGHVLVREHAAREAGGDPGGLGAELAARMLDECGGRALLGVSASPAP
jgi:hydroxymethylbilane synthase